MLTKVIIIQIMPGLSGDLEEWQTLEVNVTLCFASGDIDLLGLASPRVTLTSWVWHSSRLLWSPGIICFVIPDSSTFSCTC